MINFFFLSVRINPTYYCNRNYMCFIYRNYSSVCYGYLTLSLNKKTEPFFNHNKKKIIYIKDSKSCKDRVNEIRNECLEKGLNLGVDVEGYKIGRRGTVSILQICSEHVYLFDLHECDNKSLFVQYIKELLENKNILKITHDCREDCSVLFNKYEINVKNIFDTQVAYIEYMKQQKKEPYQISYDDLLNKFLYISNNYKLYFHKLLKCDETIYLKRPIPKELIDYAVQDVLYLNPLKSVLIDKIISLHKENDSSHEVLCKTNEKKRDAFSVSKYITALSEKYINYQYLNAHITDERLIEKGTILQGMVVAINHFRVYVKLNLNKKGVLLNYSNHKYQLGDIVSCVVLGFSNNNYIQLGLS